MTITLALCAVIVALACGSDNPEVDATTGATEQAAAELSAPPTR